MVVNGISVHLAEAGEGPLVLLLHGFPELWYSFRHQLPALADAGYHAVAPDMRGYGRTDAPGDIGRYSMLHLVGDVIGLAEALGHASFTVVGHDRSSPVAACAGLFRPDLVRGVVLLSVPYLPRGDADALTALTAALGPGQLPGVFPGAGGRGEGRRERCPGFGAVGPDRLVGRRAADPPHGRVRPGEAVG
jgi:pimeloyl-ACP methyl ester carboxylesterase